MESLLGSPIKKHVDNNSGGHRCITWGPHPSDVPMFQPLLRPEGRAILPKMCRSDLCRIAGRSLKWLIEFGYEYR